MNIFNPICPSLSDGDIEYECIPPGDDDEDAPSVIVYTERESEELERQGYMVFAFPRDR